MAEEFTQSIRKMYDGGCATFGLALGMELGLFKSMASLNRPCTSEELAREAGCKDRYVREWLNTMACAGIADYDAAKKQFYITPEKMSCLNNLTCAPVGIMAVLGQRHNMLKECFKLDGPAGINQVDQPDSIKWLTEHRLSIFDDVLEEMILKGVPGIKRKLESGISVVDLGCGSGLMAMLLAERFPNSTIWGMDFDEPQMKAAAKKADAKGLTNVKFVWADMEKLSKEWSGHFDYIFVFDVVHDLPFPKLALEETRKCLKDGGVFSMIEPNFHSSLEDNIKNHPGADPYLLSLYWCLPHSLSIPNGEGWGRCIGTEKLQEILEMAGFTDYKIIPGEMNHFVCYK